VKILTTTKKCDLKHIYDLHPLNLLIFNIQYDKEKVKIRQCGLDLKICSGFDHRKISFIEFI